jgi:hypothetical protein
MKKFSWVLGDERHAMLKRQAENRKMRMSEYLWFLVTNDAATPIQSNVILKADDLSQERID